MKKIKVSIENPEGFQEIGILEIYESRGTERYQFTYNTEWTKTGFAIDPELTLTPNIPFIDNKLWGAFQDISPDRWGRLVQTRVHDGFLAESDFMLGVSDSMRMGALRLSSANHPDVFLADHHDVPKLVHLRELEAAVQRLEAGQETRADLAMIAQPGSSLGGAHPKASVEEDKKLWLAKFQSNTDTERVSLWEATMLDLARMAGIQTANHRVLNADGDRPILLVERFDRQGGQRTPFISAMTLLGRNEASKDSGSYLELADAITKHSIQPKIDRFELFTRMTFNAITGNTDDHLRNHAFLRNYQGWRLSPAYDINPNNDLYERRTHALSFDGNRVKPSLDTCLELAEFFDLNKNEIKMATQKIASAVQNWRQAAQKNGLRNEEISRMDTAFEHKDTEKLLQLVKK